MKTSQTFSWNDETEPARLRRLVFVLPVDKKLSEALTLLESAHDEYVGKHIPMDADWDADKHTLTIIFYGAGFEPKEDQ